jgi:tRNA (guanine37-N1)-methyltransferase
MRIDVLTLFPEMFEALSSSIPGRAIDSGALALFIHQIRVHAINKHGQVDDAPYGGEAGMVLRPEPLTETLKAVLSDPVSAPRPHVILLSAQGRLLDQQRAAEIAAMDRVVLVCGHYKGVDQRFIDAQVDEQICIGEYVLSGGELPAMVLIDAVARLLPGVIGDIESADTDSFARPGRLGWPVYTRPAEFEGHGVPEVLLSGHHANIEVWRTLESLRLTRENRPDLLERYPVTPAEQDLIDPPRKKKRVRRSGTPPAE